jgi:hypothetical protein
MREAQAQQKILGKRSLKLSSHKERDDSATKNILQMKNVPRSMFI